MNRRGQALVVFIFLIPLLIFVCVLLIDVGKMIYANIELNNVTKHAINTYID